MSLESLLIGLAAIGATLAVVPAGRRLVATLIDIVDASVGMFTIRRVLRLDTTTARQRRIGRRQAREAVELARRIGALDGSTTTASASSPVAPTAAPPSPVAPNRLIASGSPGMEDGPRDGARRGVSLRDGAVAVLAVVVVVVAISYRIGRPTGEVLDATASPRERTGVVEPTDVAAIPSVAAATPSQVASPAATVPAPPVVGAVSARMIGVTAAGRTTTVELAWEVLPDAPPPSGFEVSVNVDDGGFARVATLPGDARSLEVRLGLERTSTFRLQPIGGDGPQGEPAEWAPVTPARYQESSKAVTRKGRWRGAEGPSLSGGTVVFSTDRSASLAFRFTGSDVGWVGTRTPMSGRAEVRIDGKVVDTVALDHPSVRYRQLVFRRHLAGHARHVLEIRPLGDGRVDVDAFVVLR